MKYRQLGVSELNPSVIGLGGLYFGTLCNQDQVSYLINQASASGINFIDTAPMYGCGNSETLIGEAIAGRRDRFIVATKVGLTPVYDELGRFGVRVLPLTKKTIVESVEKSLKNLKTDFIDLLQLHAFDSQTPLDETLFAVSQLVQEGKIRYFGCSNYESHHLRAANQVIQENQLKRFTSLQSHFNILERHLEKEMVPICSDFQIGIICYQALARGILANKYRSHQPCPPDTRGSSSNRIQQKLSPEMLGAVEQLHQISARYGRTASDLAIAWLLQRKKVSVVLLGVRNEDQLLQNISASQWDLGKEIEDEIDSMIKLRKMMSKVLSEPKVFLEQ